MGCSLNDKNKETPNKQDAGKVFLEEVIQTSGAAPGGRRALWINVVLVPLLAVFSGLVIGGIFIILTSLNVYTAFQESIGAGLAESWKMVATSYTALFNGAFGNPANILSALESGQAAAIRRAFNPFLESLVASTPYIFAGLAVALGFRAGVFNIGAEGQLFMGAIAGTFVGYSVQGLPAAVHIPLTLLAGFLGGALWGFIPGWLKAKTGGHEVINTIMMNYIAFRLSEWLLRGPMQRPNSFNPISPVILESARLPRFFGEPIRFHLGFFIALLLAYLVYWFLFKTTWGFTLRTVGASSNAAKYAGMSVANSIILAMALSGGLAGLAGINEVAGVNYFLAVAFSSGYGFDAIALALLGKNHPAGVVLAALLFGFLRNGAVQMQLQAGIPVDIISILQAVILIFIAAPAIIRTVYRLRLPGAGEGEFTFRSWGG